jgi:hypothetical protein
MASVNWPDAIVHARVDAQRRDDTMLVVHRHTSASIDTDEMTTTWNHKWRRGMQRSTMSSSSSSSSKAIETDALLWQSFIQEVNVTVNVKENECEEYLLATSLSCINIACTRSCTSELGVDNLDETVTDCEFVVCRHLGRGRTHGSRYLGRLDLDLSSLDLYTGAYLFTQ